MDHPIVIVMEDEIIHTDAHPVCDDPTCPCHAPQSNRKAGVTRTSLKNGASRQVSRKRREDATEALHMTPEENVSLNQTETGETQRGKEA